MPRPLAVAMLICTTLIWGFAFIAQKSAMDTMGPFTFAGVRYLIGGLCILPLALREWHRRSGPPLTTRQWQLVAIICIVFFAGSLLQQVGLLTTTVTNGGFLTGLYVFFTPLFGYLVFRTRPHPIVLICVPLALVGMFYLNGGRLDRFTLGDFLVIGCAAFWGVHVLLLGIVSRDTRLPIAISALTFIVAGLVALPLAFVFETPTLEGISASWVQLAYSAILSTAVAFTFQAIAQQYVPAANAAIILSSESLFAAIGGAIILGERLLPIGYAGAALMFAAIVAVEVVPALSQRKASRPA